MQPPRLGQQARVQRTVAASDTAEQFGNAGVRVLATPVLCAWFENAALACIQTNLEQGEATVGTKLSIEHLAATPLGMLVSVEAELVEIDRRRLTFRIEARDEQEVIGRGLHERFVIDLQRFLERVAVKVVTPE